MNNIKRNLQTFSHDCEDKILTLPWLLEPEHLTPEKIEAVNYLSKEVEILDFQLGDSLISYPEPSSNYVSDEQNSQYFFWVCTGKVRLLSFDAAKQREVSTHLLTEADTIGGDSLWCKFFLPYRAIAASEVRVARISLAKLKRFLNKLPELQSKCQSEAKERQKLIFLKTLTELRSISSHRLKSLSPYLTEKQIVAGKSIASNSEDAARCWLRSGQIEGSKLKIGSSWGYPGKTPQTWNAKTDLWIYQVTQQNWQAFAEIAPDLFASWKQDDNHNKSVSVKENATSIATTSQLRTYSSPVAYRANSPQPKAIPQEDRTPQIEYPQPQKHRPSLWRNYPFIEQQSSSDCGATCLAMISQYWGKRFGINFLRELIGTGRVGASLKSLAKAAESLGYHARPVRASLSRIIEQKNPWIAHWEGDHYIVVYRVKGDRILVADPAKGKYQLSRQDFLAFWTGYALVLDPTENLYEVPEEKRSLGRFLYLLWPYRSLGLTIILASILIQLFGLVSPLFTQIILDQVVVNRSQSTLNVFVIGLFLFGILGIGLSSIRSYLLSYLSNRLDLTMIGGFINHALNLPLKFFESRRVGDIITRVQENQKIQAFLIEKIMLSWLDFVTGFVYLGLMLYYNWRLTLLVLLLIPPIIILTLIATPLLRKISREQFNATADQNSSLVEMMSGISTVKAVAAERNLRWRWEDRLTKQLNVDFRGDKLAINLGLLNGLVNSIGGTLLLWYGASLVIQGELSIGQYVAFNMMKGYIISPVITLADLWDELQEVLISVERLNDVFETKSEEPPQSNKIILPKLQGHVKFDNVTFRYDLEEDSNTLQNISFEVRPGQTIAIVGRSGSGKSTLVKLLQGLYHPISGQVTVDGHDINHVSLQSLRSQLGVVPQDCFLFSGTILENITLYRSDYSLEQVVETAKLAEANAFIQALPLGYSTKVGEHGANLSGGQRQRIAIARAFLGEPPILILDEATSSLDTESERRFQENLSRLSRNRTTFIIAHRLSTVRNANFILVLDRGLIVEQGTHKELIAQQGLYYQLAKQQLDL
ncbi:ABC transporter transmembrane domain-containing protein [Myxosarcina sp. GI1]|uniref:ABC transporter transmembrane domain-containing protein n=1 Tax=Myxosarcina sp. GI1 TaxID=1541065 RepID=UPI00068D27DA|nr:ABC transporter transmembrane domain-containing protein [Myxosarcina sp. GI1]